jgi:hypothetical protein
VFMHRNGTRALGVLGSSVGSRWHGRGGVHGRSQAGLPRGIGPRVQCGTGSEVTAWGVVGGALPQLGAPGGHGDALGERGVDERCLCEVGSGEGSSRSGDRPLGVGLVEQKGERERGPSRVWSRAPLPSFDPTRYDKGRSLARFCVGL